MSNLINNDAPLPSDVTLAAAVAAEAAKLDPTGGAAFRAQENLGAALFQAQQYAERQAYVDKTNEPVLAQMRAEEEQRTRNLMTGVVAVVGTLGVATLALEATGGVVGAWNRSAANDPAKEPTTSEMGPTHSFGSRAMKTLALAQELGRAPPAETMMFSAPFMATGMAGLVADPSAPDPSANDPSQSVARMQSRRNTAFMLKHNSLASGPKPPTVRDRYGA